MPNNMKKAGRKYKYGAPVYNKQGTRVPGMYQGGREIHLPPDHEMAHVTQIPPYPGDKPKHNWNEKLNRLVNKRKKRKEKGRSTKNIQKRINKEYNKINP